MCGRHAGATKNAFGGRSCPSCRAYFQRIVQTGKADSLKCMGRVQDQCEINSRSWRSCGKCRFRKCLAMGMSVGLVPPKTAKQKSETKKR